jgi:trans-aconitate methyltransferase
METQNSEYWKNRPINDPYRDWKTESPSWIEEYWKTKNHPHRKQIINILRKLQPWTSLLEIGCNCGVNLANIRKKFGNVSLCGIDANKEAIEFGRKKLPDVVFWEDTVENMIVKDCDILLADAVLMYVSDKDIYNVMNVITTFGAKKAIILCEWYDDSKLGVLKGGHWARNYPALLKEFGWKVREKKIIWPTSEKWQKFGKIFVAVK